MPETIVQLPGEISKIETRKNQALRIVFDSQEAIQPEVRARLMSCVDLVGWMSFLPTTDRMIDPMDIAGLPEIPKREEQTKSQSSRFRSVLFVYWKQEKMTMPFEHYYQAEYEKLIEDKKSKLEPRL